MRRRPAAAHTRTHTHDARLTAHGLNIFHTQLPWQPFHTASRATATGNTISPSPSPPPTPPHPNTAANRAPTAFARLLLSVHVCVAYNTAQPILCVCVCLARQHSDSMAHTCIHINMFVCVCQGHWQKAEVLLGNDFSFLFAPAPLPFRGRLLCSAPLLYKLYIFASAPALPLPCSAPAQPSTLPSSCPTRFPCVFDCCWRFR